MHCRAAGLRPIFWPSLNAGRGVGMNWNKSWTRDWLGWPFSAMPSCLTARLVLLCGCLSLCFSLFSLESYLLCTHTHTHTHTLCWYLLPLSYQKYSPYPHLFQFLLLLLKCLVILCLKMGKWARAISELSISWVSNREGLQWLRWQLTAAERRTDLKFWQKGYD